MVAEQGNLQLIKEIPNLILDKYASFRGRFQSHGGYKR